MEASSGGDRHVFDLVRAGIVVWAVQWRSDSKRLRQRREHKMQPEQTTTLDRTFEHARTNLKHALDEACRADISRADTGELIRVEEVLAIANEAAKEAIS